MGVLFLLFFSIIVCFSVLRLCAHNKQKKRQNIVASPHHFFFFFINIFLPILLGPNLLEKPISCLIAFQNSFFLFFSSEKESSNNYKAKA